MVLCFQRNRKISQDNKVRVFILLQYYESRFGAWVKTRKIKLF